MITQFNTAVHRWVEIRVKYVKLFVDIVKKNQKNLVKYDY